MRVIPCLDVDAGRVDAEQLDRVVPVGGQRRHQLLDAGQQIHVPGVDLLGEHLDVTRDAVVDQRVDDRVDVEGQALRHRHEVGDRIAVGVTHRPLEAGPDRGDLSRRRC